ncbi:MAG: hypothetical protein A3F18_04085 [Legionellales bacterium RIFCSPHIGHO2_12_FULL_37_14]|nr:MAG: hypothetical protein A3F18_04085 [Legionellales bacterium RIFCSPHIGHO2_12_FULL_37_14]
MLILFTDLQALITEVIPTVDVATFDSSLTFTEAGMDSLDVFSFFMKVEAKYGFSIPEHDFGKMNTFQDVLNYSNSLLSMDVT